MSIRLIRSYAGETVSVVVGLTIVFFVLKSLIGALATLGLAVSLVLVVKALAK